MLMSRKDLVADLKIGLRKHNVNVSEKVVASIIDEVLSTIADQLIRGNEVQFKSFGTFKLYDTKTRMGRNPATGESVEIAGKRTVKFKPGKGLRDKVKASTPATDSNANATEA